MNINIQNRKIAGSGPDYYKHMSPDYYRENINTPSRSIEYFEKFHRPLIEYAKAKFGSPIRLIDIACGPGYELDFIKDDQDVKITATDISSEIVSKVKEKLGENANVFAKDASSTDGVGENIAEAGILLNAVIYNPDRMLTAMYKALRPGGRCVVNFNVYTLTETVTNLVHNPRERIFLNSDLVVSTKDGPRTFPVKVVDYTHTVKRDGSPDLAMRQLGQQVYLKNIKDVRELIMQTGFLEVDHKTFHYKKPNTDIDTFTEVFVLEKPE